MIKLLKIFKSIDGALSSQDDCVIVEEPLQIKVCYEDQFQPPFQDLSITMRSPGHDIQLASGFLFTEGIVESKDEIRGARYALNEVIIHLDRKVKLRDKSKVRNFYTTSSCGVCGKSSIDQLSINAKPFERSDKLDIELIPSMYNRIFENSNAFNRTGGNHSAGVYNYDGLQWVVCEDVGRHNAVDKCCGFLMEMNVDFTSPKILCLSGRACYELIQKAILMGCTSVISIGAPSSLAVETCLHFNITLIGFYKQNKFNIYSGENFLTGVSMKV